MTSVVTGASGLIGANLVRLLLERGERVTALVHRHTAALDGLDLTRAQGDVLQPETLRAAFAGAEHVYHLAAIVTLETRPRAPVWSVNVEGVRNVIEACRACGVKRLVHFSSIEALSPHPLDGVVDETRPLRDERDISPYAASKVAAERLVLEQVKDGLDAVIVHPTGVVGPHDYRPSAMGKALINLYRRRLPALPKGGFDWVDVRDVCQGAVAAAKDGRPGERYLLSGAHLSLRGLAQCVEEITGVKAPPFDIPIGIARLGLPFTALYSRLTGRPSAFTRMSLRAIQEYHQVSCGTAARAFAYRPRPIRQTLEDTFAWFREVGYL